MRIFTESIGKQWDDLEDDQTIRALITRFFPRGKTWKELGIDFYLPELSPSRKLLSFKKNNPTVTWDQFITEFENELKSDIKSYRALKLLNKLAKKFNVVLLCYEKEGEPCHRYIVKQILDNESWWNI